METFSGIVQDHFLRYPLLEIQDLYKLTFQAALGAEHAAGLSRDAIHNYLMQELTLLVEGPAENLVEKISPDGRILRVHLRPFIRAGGRPLKLSQAFWESTQAHHGTIELLEKYWKETLKLARIGLLPFEVKAMESYFSDRRAGEFEPVHHSVAFRDAYKPAYRVVLNDYWEY